MVTAKVRFDVLGGIVHESEATWDRVPHHNDTLASVDASTDSPPTKGSRGALRIQCGDGWLPLGLWEFTSSVGAAWMFKRVDGH